MSTIENIFEPSRLLLVWHHTNSDTPRHRRVVGELIRQGDDAAFRYLKDTEDFEAALDEGFFEFPAFADKNGQESQLGALDVFVRRLPPRKREDFKEYLAQYNLPSNFSGSAFSLLAYTGARLASDTFELCPDLSDAKAPLDFVIDVSGIQYHIDGKVQFLEDDEIFFKEEPENQFDHNAIKIIHSGHMIGYVNKALSPSFSRLLKTGKIKGTILKFSMQKNTPKLLVLVRYF
jgi:hypothetical protein